MSPSPTPTNRRAETARVVHTGAEPRLVALTAVRALMIGITASSAFLDTGYDAATRGRVLIVVVAWSAVLVVVELCRRADVGHAVVRRASPLLDGLLLVAAAVAAGGSSTPLYFLAFIHVIASTLLVSYLTGLKVAMWDSALLMVAAAAQTAGAVPFLAGGDGAQAFAAAIWAVALLVVAVVTAGASALNERELRRSREGLKTMLATGQALMGTHRTEEAMQIALAALTESLGFETSALVVKSLDAPPRLARRQRGLEVAPVTADRDMIIKPPAGPVLRARAADVEVPFVAELLADRHNVVVVPLMGQRAHGVLAAAMGGRPRGRGLPVRTLELIQSLAAQLSQTLDRVQLSAAIAEMAAKDGLTHVANRRRFDERLVELLASAVTTQQPLSLLVIDIDHFKAVNDTHGHQVGDEVLKQVAATLEEAKRVDDFLARYGGEEFALLLPVTDRETAGLVAERLRAAVAAAPTAVPVTVSIGVATTMDAAIGPAGLFAAADKALYAAKAAGRNRVHRAALPWRAPAPQHTVDTGRWVSPVNH